MPLHLEPVATERISRSEDFRISFHSSAEALPGFAEFGILQPPILFPADADEAELKIVCGFRRIAQAREAGFQSVLALVCRGWDRKQALTLSLIERLSHGPLNEVERARCFDLFLRGGWARPELSEHLGRLLGVRISPLLLDQWRALLASPRLVQESVAGGTMHLYTAFRLSRWMPQDLRIAQWFAAFRLGVNRQRELLDLLEDLVGSGPAAGPVLEELDAIAGRTDPAGVSEAWIRYLKTLRFPRLTEFQRRFDENRARLRLPGRMNLTAPPYFEENRYKVTFPFGSREELELCARKLLEVSAAPELEEMLKLV